MSRTLPEGDLVDRTRMPVDPWALVDTAVPTQNLGRWETLFGLGNGYLGIRGTPPEGADVDEPGTFVNGFHETFPIRHAEEAYGFARIGQAMLTVPDATVMRLFVDDEPLLASTADLESYERRLDLRRGVLERDLVWRAPSGVRVRVVTRRLVSFSRRHLAVMTLEATPLDADAQITVMSTLVNRLDVSEPLAPAGPPSSAPSSAPPPSPPSSPPPPAPGSARPGAGFGDPRKADRLDEHVLQPELAHASGGRAYLGYRAASSRMTLAVGVDHACTALEEIREHEEFTEDAALHEFRVDAKAGHRVAVTKLVAYHTSRSAAVADLAHRCRRTLDDARRAGVDRLIAEQRRELDAFWARADVEIPGRSDLQQAVRLNLFHVAQASLCAAGHGIPAKGLVGTGYSGHYFWDGETYVLPFLTYTSPDVARALLRFRCTMLPAARRRARELNVSGALFPWRTINGSEASANYAQGTAQYHIDADIAYALLQYAHASGDQEFLARRGGADLLVETARMWADLGFMREDGSRVFHIHGVTGPDEYTTVVNDNLYTNVMARGNLREAARVVHDLARDDPDAYARLADRVDLRDQEVEEWEDAARTMCIPWDEHLGIHPQDDSFLSKEVWDLPATPEGDLPLLLHFHPLVIYRFQVIKQTDVVLAEFLHSSEFTAEQKVRDFRYYEALTTGDSSLSAVAQAVMAAEVGHADLALEHFRHVIHIDLADLHGNTADGIHVASAGGVWSALVCGFGGMRDDSGVPDLDPRLPAEWEGLVFRLTLGGVRVRVEVRPGRVLLSVDEGDSPGLPGRPGSDRASAVLRVQGRAVEVAAGVPVEVPLSQVPTVSEEPAGDIAGARRPDGSLIEPRFPGHALHEPDAQQDDTGAGTDAGTGADLDEQPIGAE